MNRWVLRIGLVGLVSVLVLLVGPSPAAAALACQTVGDHRLCLETAKRSAKYFWQYQAAVTVDGQPLPIQRYDCRPQAPAPSIGIEPGDTSARDSTLAAAEIQGFVCRAVTPRR
ncbi:MAG: hypothetical protein ACHWZW_21795 [Spirulina sp.]